MSGKAVKNTLGWLFAGTLLLCIVASAVGQQPKLPAALVDTECEVSVDAKLWAVATAAQLQAALNGANPGDVIELRAGTRFVGHFVLPRKDGDRWIHIRSSRHARLPRPGERVSPAMANLMPKIISPDEQPAIRTDFGAHHYCLMGLEITTALDSTSLTNWNLVLLGSGPDGESPTSVRQLPHHLVFDRCYFHGTPTGNVRRGVLLEGSHLAVLNSYLSDFHEVGADAQALCGTNGPGPIKIENNYLEASGENLMFGGMKPSIANLVPSDIEVRGNHFRKPFTWRVGHPDYAGIEWSIKNLFELKNARRVLVQGNVFENSWEHAQVGYAVLFTPRGHGAPWSTVEDVTFVDNLVRHASSGFSIMSIDGEDTSQVSKRILMRNNLLYDINKSKYGGDGFLFQIAAGDPRNPIESLTIEHNTALHGCGEGLVLTVGPKSPAAKAFVFRGNLVTHAQYGIHGDDVGVGGEALRHFLPGYTFEKNLLIIAPPELETYSKLYPGDNYFAAIGKSLDLSDLSREDIDRLYLTPLKSDTSSPHPGADLSAQWAAWDQALSK